VYSAYEIKRCAEGTREPGGIRGVPETSVSTVQKMEGREKNPSGTALKLLDLVERKGLKALA